MVWPLPSRRDQPTALSRKGSIRTSPLPVDPGSVQGEDVPVEIVLSTTVSATRNHQLFFGDHLAALSTSNRSVSNTRGRSITDSSPCKDTRPLVSNRNDRARRAAASPGHRGLFQRISGPLKTSTSRSWKLQARSSPQLQTVFITDTWKGDADRKLRLVGHSPSHPSVLGAVQLKDRPTGASSEGSTSRPPSHGGRGAKPPSWRRPHGVTEVDLVQSSVTVGEDTEKPTVKTN